MSPTLEAQKENALKAFYATIGAPLVTGRKLRDYSVRFASDVSVDEFEAEGRKITGQIQDAKVVEQVQHAVDVEQLQEQVEKLRDQLESVLVNWRHGFRPATEEKPAPAPKPAAKKPAAKKPATKKPAAKKPATKAATKKPAAKKPAPKTES